MSTFCITSKATRPECSVCDLMMGKLLKRLDDINGIDIYLMDVGLGKDTEVRAWASTQKIDPKWVKNRRITLNYDSGTLDKLSKGRILLLTFPDAF